MMRMEVVGEIRGLGSDFTLPFTRIEERLLRSQRANFIEGGRPNRWPALKTGQPSHLTVSGAMMFAIHSTSGADFAEAESGAFPYTMIHQFGGWAGRGHAAYIPPRPYMLFQQEDINFAIAEIRDAVFTSPNSADSLGALAGATPIL